MRLWSDSKVTFSGNRPPEEIGSALNDRSEIPLRLKKLTTKFLKNARNTLCRGQKPVPITTTRAHGINWSQLHKTDKFTSLPLNSLIKETPKDWELPLGHPERCQGLVLQTMSQCPRPNVLGQSYCQICLESSMSTSPYFNAASPRTRELIEQARTRREEEGTSLNDEIDLVRAMLSEVVEMRGKLDSKFASNSIDSAKYMVLLGQIDQRQREMIDMVVRLVDNQRRIDEFRNDVISNEEFARRTEGLLAEFRRRLVDDTRGLLPGSIHEIISDRYEDASSAVLDAIWPDGPLTSVMRSSINGNLLAAFSRAKGARDIGRTVNIEII
jgi:hypothetical protein